MSEYTCVTAQGHEVCTWYVYGIYPIDVGWPPGSRGIEGVPGSVLKAAREFLYWEGDVLAVAFLRIPDDVHFAAAVAWKQENNGNTYVASQVPLPHLEALSFAPPVRVSTVRSVPWLEEEENA